MPKLSSDKLTAEIIKIKPDMPILLCTGFSETMTEDRTAALGIKGFLMKPVLIKDLAEKIRTLLDAKTVSNSKKNEANQPQFNEKLKLP